MKTLMTSTTKCKNCGQQAKWTYWTGPYGIEEESIICDCGYFFEFTYGGYAEKFPEQVTMVWRHDDMEKKPCSEY